MDQSKLVQELLKLAAEDQDQAMATLARLFADHERLDCILKHGLLFIPARDGPSCEFVQVASREELDRYLEKMEA